MIGAQCSIKINSKTAVTSQSLILTMIRLGLYTPTSPQRTERACRPPIQSISNARLLSLFRRRRSQSVQADLYSSLDIKKTLTMRRDFTVATALFLVLVLQLVCLDRSAFAFGFQAVAPFASTTTGRHYQYHHHGRHAAFDQNSNNLVSPFQIAYTTNLHRRSTRLFMSERSEHSDLKASTVAGHHPHDNANGPRHLIQSWQSASNNVLQGVMSRIRSNMKVDEITLWRCAAVMFVTSLAIFHTRIDAGLVTLWEYLTTSTSLCARWFRHDRT